MSANHEKFMKMAIDEARKGLAAGEQPFGSVVVKDGEVVGRGHNRVNSSGDPTTHAEVEAVRDAAANLGGPDLSGTTLYTSCDPCPMCGGSMLMSSVGALVVGARSAFLAELQGRPARTYTAEELAKQMFSDLKVTRGVLQDEAEAALAEYKNWRKPR